MAPTGLILLSFGPIAMVLGSFIADYNETHVLNPDWPGHARFHNGQTMSMSILLGISALYYTWRSLYLPSLAAKRESLFAAALFGSIYCATGISAQFYPGSLCVDRKFWKNGEHPGCPQNFIFGIPLVINWIGYFLALREAQGIKKSV